MNKEYVGTELEMFQFAQNWKHYFSSFFRPYVRGQVAEVGAGIGANVPYFMNSSVKHYQCFEPDSKLAAQIQEKIQDGRLPPECSVQADILPETLQDAFDTILYIDVIEHIADDAAEIAKAARALRPGGSLCVLVPANPKDYSAFDKSVGHFRRYTRQSLLQLVQPPLTLDWCRYLDSVGSLASKTNKLLLQQSLPSQKQVKVWDRLLVPASRLFDKASGYRFGKSLLLVAKKAS